MAKKPHPDITSLRMYMRAHRGLHEAAEIVLDEVEAIAPQEIARSAARIRRALTRLATATFSEAVRGAQRCPAGNREAKAVLAVDGFKWIEHRRGNKSRGGA